MASCPTGGLVEILHNVFFCEEFPTHPHSDSCTEVSWCFAQNVYKQRRLNPQLDSSPRCKKVPHLSDMVLCDLASGPSRSQVDPLERASGQYSPEDAGVSKWTNHWRNIRKGIFFLWIKMYKIWCIHQTALKWESIFQQEAISETDSKSCYSRMPASICRPVFSVVAWA